MAPTKPPPRRDLFVVSRDSAAGESESSLRLNEARRDLLRAARRVVALTGAGISAESGIPTFREAQAGLWSDFDPEELATVEGFVRNPRKVLTWYSQRRERALSAQPNPAHLALAEWQEHLDDCLVVTQNTDGLHLRAGSREVVELHGNLLRDRPFDDPRAEQIAADLPRCTDSGLPLRPDVVWFGEPLPPFAYETAVKAIQHCDLLLVIGTSGLVQPAANLPLEALERDIPVVEINVSPTPLTPVVNWNIPAPAAVALPQLLTVAIADA